MNRNFSGVRTTLAGMVALLLIGGLATAMEGVQNPRLFELGAESSTVVLEYRRTGGLSRDDAVYKLHGDGRLVWELTSATAGSVTERVEVQLTPPEAEDLVGILVHRGIVECDADCIESKCARSAGVERIPPTRDCGGVLITLNLAKYQGPGEMVARPVHQRSYHECPRALATFYCPDLPEAHWMLDMGKALRERKEAERGVVP